MIGTGAGERLLQRSASEEGLQRGFLAELQVRTGADVLVCSIPNERPGAAAGRMVGLGLRKGMPDLMVLWRVQQGAGGGWWSGTGFLEFKAPKGRLDPAQRDCHDRLRQLGFPVAVVRASSEAFAALEAWGVPMLRDARGRLVGPEREARDR